MEKKIVIWTSIVVLIVIALTITFVQPKFYKKLVYHELSDDDRSIEGTVIDFKEQCWTDYGPIMVNWNRHYCLEDTLEALFEAYNKNTSEHWWATTEEIAQYLFDE